MNGAGSNAFGTICINVLDMRRGILIFCFAFVLCTMLPAAEKGDTLKLMTYNIRFGELSDMKTMAEYISSEQPDVAALQECDWNTHRGNAPHQNGVRFLNELSYHTGMFGIYAKAIDFSGGYYGIGLLSRYPVLRYERVLLPNDGQSEQRVMLVADIELPGGEVITFVNTHLEVKTAQIRLEQINFINGYLKECPNRLFLAGDMNASPDSNEIRLLGEEWQSLTDQDFTFHSSDPKVKLDYIYVKTGHNVELLSTDVRENVSLSDHFPVVSTVILH